jgi:hypothetical protein
MPASNDFKHITIISVNGLQERVGATLNALLLSSRHLPGARCVLVSPYLPESTPRHVKHVPIAPIGYLDYSVFVLYCLCAFVETDFALVVQDDGWVLNPDRWQPRFLEYDFVGAPVHIARVHTPAGPRFMRHFTWTSAQPELPIDQVLNGGFSLRSRRALLMPRSLPIPYQVPSVPQLAGPPYAMKFPNHEPNEDVQLCTYMRPALEAAGVKFAPLEVAKEFAIEHASKGVHDGFNLATLFGHHSKLRKLLSIDPLVVQYVTSEQQTATISGEMLIVTLLEKLGYEVRFAPSG